jgi:type I restriction enzyme S subunit
MNVGRLDYIPDHVYVDESHRLSYGDVLFNTRNTLDLVGKVSIWREELPVAYYNSNILRLEFKKEILGDSRYFGYALNTRKMISEIRALATGTTSVAAVYTRDLVKLQVPVPSVNEQRTIADALGNVDALIDALDCLITKKRDVKQGMMQELLTGRTRLPGFTGNWKQEKLAAVATMGSGGTPPSSVTRYYGGGIPWVSISDMTRGGKYIANTDKTLTEVGLTSSAAKLYEPDVVLYAMYASLGECSLAVGRVASSQAILGIKVSYRLDREFLYYVLQSLKSQVKLLGQQGTQSNLNAGMVGNFDLDLPPIEEQLAIASVLKDADDEIDALHCQLASARAVKVGMMQELLTGRTRLPVTEEA